MNRPQVFCLSVLVAVGLGGCGGVSGLNGTPGKTSWGSISVTRGQAGDFTAFLVNHSGGTVTLESAKLIPLKGFATPRLRGMAIEPGRGFVGAGRGSPLAQSRIETVRFRGFKLRDGYRAQVLYAIAGPGVGRDYAAEGVVVSVREGSSAATVKVIGPGGICVLKKLGDCSKTFENRFTRAAQALANAS